MMVKNVYFNKCLRFFIDHDLVLNQNPLSLAQQVFSYLEYISITPKQYVGPGYYETKSGFQSSKYQGPAWHKSGVKKIEGFSSANATAETVGPGRYNL